MKFIKRRLLPSLLNHLSSDEMTLIIGPRQVGKTTLLFKIKEFVEQEGKSTLYFNLDIDEDASFFESQAGLISKIELSLGKEKGVVFIDEIQRKENVGLFLKGLYDRRLPYKFVITGSGSVELKEKIVESLVGRMRTFELKPVSLSEFFHWKTQYRYEGKMATFVELHKAKIHEWLKEYLIYGGYPKVVLANSEREKQETLRNIFDSYILRDINRIIHLNRPEAFEKLFRMMAHRTSRIINYSKLAQVVGISTPTVSKYIWYAEKTYTIKLVKPFYTNPGKELSKAPVLYFNDLGLCRYARRNFRWDSANDTIGFDFQNLLYHLLDDYFEPFEDIKYWRTKDKAEVDFVIDKGDTPLPIEIKYRTIKKPTIEIGLRNFIHLYQPKKAWIINLAFSEELQVGQTTATFLPYWKLLK